ncbi:MAG: amidohydrolase family protein [Candidatus Latescibacteria bacterium]|nr:amidohydrolase family protein [Candidatus Latescibacterota bacterium]
MIVDSHAYCFQPGDSPAGFARVEDRLMWIQSGQAAHHQPAWRVRDRAPASSEGLGPQDRSGWSVLPDVDFRIDHEKGRVAWTIYGEEYTKQFYPPNLRNLAFTPHSLIAEMDYAGVDRALLHTNPMLGRDCAFLAACVQAYPDRLRSMAPVDEWRIVNEPDAVIEEITTAIGTHKLHAVKFNTTLAYLESTHPWDDGPYRPFWEAVVALDVPVFFTLGAGPELGYRPDQQQGFLNELHVLMRWMNRYGETVCSITHGFPWRVFFDGVHMTFPDAIWTPFKNPNLSLEVCFSVRLGDLIDFPYKEIWPTLAEMVEHIGADRLLWGTDMPFQNGFCTYRQSRDWIEKYDHGLSLDDLAMIMGGTAGRILEISD